MSKAEMIPQNEMGVIVLFAQAIVDKPIEFVSIRSNHPDAVIKVDGKEYRVEFELTASMFISHFHDIRECDIVVCWENNAPEDFILPVWALSQDDWFKPISLPTPEQRELAYWKRRAHRAERRLNGFQLSIIGNDDDNKTSYKDAPPKDTEGLIYLVAERAGDRTFGQMEVQEWTGLGKTSVYALIGHMERVGKVKRVHRGTYVCKSNVPDTVQEVA